MTVMNWVDFFLAVSALLLVVPFVFARQIIGSDTGTPETLKLAGAIRAFAKALLKRPYKPAAALLGLLLPTFAAAQDHAGGGEAWPSDCFSASAACCSAWPSLCS